VTICRRELLRAALGAILFGGGSGFVGIVISAFIGALTGIANSDAIRPGILI